MLHSRLLLSSLKSLPLQTRSFSSTPSFDDGFKTITVIGAGLMGAGIAQVTAASSHYKVNLVDVDEKALSKGISSITGSLQKKFKASADPSVDPAKQIEEVVSKITPTTNLQQAVSQSDLVIEAIVENLKIKRDLFSKIHSAAPKHAVFASNTSSLSIGEISQGFRPDQFGGLHFFNPVPVMKLCEIIKTKETSEETEKKLESFVKKIGKVGVKCADTPGFIVNRLLVPYLLEAIRMYERGDATKEDIDTAMKLGCGYPMGPFSLLDYVGLDTTKYIIDGWSQKFPEESLFKPSPLLNDLVKEGKLGNKTAKGGFYSK